MFRKQQDSVQSRGSELPLQSQVGQNAQMGIAMNLLLRRTVADWSPCIRREKRQQRSTFDLQKSVHEAEYRQVKRPIDSQTKEPIEPAHKFEVSLEPDNFTDEKSEYTLLPGVLILIRTAGMLSLRTTRRSYIMSYRGRSRDLASNAFYALV